ncbi:uncharacterized protein KY384_004278 [Bacidia gigantensis]|uniref:uncharacterized protein n=1 Tax=Bacidia gigantensis TaxID=2732470 RepID=UPI001D0561B1|nr:uncharacterized protein KY384_004278 [Bacidia gigantensis]KAG8530921.1 hypothetical protein KY384_004278 [Bacidia gigantensis]
MTLPDLLTAWAGDSLSSLYEFGQHGRQKRSIVIVTIIRNERLMKVARRPAVQVMKLHTVHQYPKTARRKVQSSVEDALPHLAGLPAVSLDLDLTLLFVFGLTWPLLRFCHFDLGRTALNPANHKDLIPDRHHIRKPLSNGTCLREGYYMDPFNPHIDGLPGFSSTMMRPKMDPYKVDEGYSEDTRSQDGSESSMKLDIRDHSSTTMRTQPPVEAHFADFIRGLGEHERSGMDGSGVLRCVAYDLLRGLRASSIATVFDRLWPLFHKDPLEVFPTEIMSLVLSWLEPHDLMNVSLVSRAWRDRVTDGGLWKEKFSVEGWGLDTREIERFENKCRDQQGQLSADQTDRSLYQSYWRPPRSEASRSPARPNSSEMHNHLMQAIADQQCAGRGADTDVEMTDVKSEKTSITREEHVWAWPASPSSQRFSPTNTKSEPSNSRRTSLKPPLLMSVGAGQSRFNYQYIFKQKKRLEDNWDKGRYKNFQLPHRDFPQEAHEECVYTIQYQGNYLVSGSRDRTLRIWDLSKGRLWRSPLRGHTGSVLCLQFDSRPEEDIIVSGSSDTNVILWRFSTGTVLKKIVKAHEESVLNLRFDHRFLVTCSKDKTIKIWNRHELRPGDPDYPVKGVADGGACPAYIIDAQNVGTSIRYQPSTPEHLTVLEPYMHLMTLNLHGAAVNAIQIYKDQLVSASGDRHLRVWNIHTGECHSRIQAHEKGIACVQYDGKRIVSGSSDNSIRIWDPATRTEVARLEGHERLVRTLQAAFADVPGGREGLEAEAAEVDRLWHVARENGEDLKPNRPGRPARPGSRRPRDLRTLGAKIPPSGGGSRWARIISGSYDEKVIIWKKNADDEWVMSHQLAQEEALTAAGPPLFNRVHVNSPPRNVPRGPPPIPLARPNTPDLSLIDQSLDHPAADNRSMPPRSDQQPPSPRPDASVTDHIPHDLPDSQQSHETALIYPPNNSQRQSTAGPSSGVQIPPSPTLPPPSYLTQALPAPAGRPSVPASSSNPQQVPAVPSQTAAPPRPPPGPPQNGAPPVGQPNARVFKLQFDARRIVCCSQDNKIVGWDFANGDENIMAASRFFADLQ